MIGKDIPQLTGLRGIAALWVFVYHSGALIAGTFAVPAIQPLGAAGYLGVDLFFVLSGFVLALNYSHHQLHRNASRYLSFLWKRVARIYPAHVAAIVFLCILLLAFAASGMVYMPPSRLELNGLLSTLTLTHAWSIPIDKTWNAVSWSISCEWAAYLCFPVISAAANRFKSTAAICTMIVLLFTALAAVVHFGSYRGTMAYGMPRIAVEFTAGTLLFRLWSVRNFSRSARGDWIAWIGFAVMIAGGNLAAMLSSPDTPIILAPIAACAIVYGLASGNGSLCRWLATRTAVFAGEISYSFYLVHMLVLGAFARICIEYGWLGSARHAIPGLGLALLCSILLAVWMYHSIERPARQRMLSIRPPRPTRSPAEKILVRNPTP